MDATELRIGNLVDIKGYNDEINTTQCDVDDIKWCTISPTSYIPIPLTEEWLEKFGFEKSDNGAYATYGIEQFDLLGGITEDESIFLVWKNDEILTNLKCVHQLQNLYHSLTGEELTIKEKIEG